MGKFLTNEYVVRGTVILYFLAAIAYRIQNRDVGSNVLLVLELIYLVLIIYVFIIRIPAVNQAKGLAERAIPLIAIVFITMNSFLPVTQRGLFNYAAVLIAVGLVIQIVGIFTLRRSFSFFVEARELMTAGIYKFIRHPIYLGTLISATGLFVLRISWFALLFIVLIFIWELYRAFLEEKKLVVVFQPYKAYQQNTPFIIPFVKMKKEISPQFRPTPPPPPPSTAQPSETNQQNQNEENISG